MARRYGVLPHVIRDLPPEELGFARLCRDAGLQEDADKQATNPSMVFPVVVVQEL